jgi:hypothetical protein
MMGLQELSAGVGHIGSISSVIGVTPDEEEM